MKKQRGWNFKRENCTITHEQRVEAGRKGGKVCVSKGKNKYRGTNKNA